MAKDILTKSRFLYGQLNPIERDKNVDLYDPDADPLHYVRNRIRKDFAANATDGVMRFKAIVLRVYKSDSGISSWWDNITDWLTGEETAPKIKAMIPEIHGSILPTPSTLGTESRAGIIPSADNLIIDMYPTFAYKSNRLNEELSSEEIARIVPGSIVWVTFGNIENLTDPILLGPATDQTNIGAGGLGSRNTIQNGQNPNCFSAHAPKGGFLSCHEELEIRTFPDIIASTQADDVGATQSMPRGKGIFTSEFPDIEIQKVVDADAAGVDWICVLAKKPQQADIDKKADVVSLDKLQKFVEAYKRYHIKVYIWGQPYINKTETWIQEMFSLAHSTGCNGVIADIKTNFIPLNPIDAAEAKAKTATFAQSCKKAAQDAQVTFGITSYGRPSVEGIFPGENGGISFLSILKQFAGENYAVDFVLPKAFMDDPKDDMSNMLAGLLEYKDIGLNNRIAFTSFGIQQSDSYKVLYPTYKSELKPPEEILKRTAWLFGEEAEKYAGGVVIDYEGAVAFWSWEIAHKKNQPNWPMNLWALFSDFKGQLESYVNLQKYEANFEGFVETNPGFFDSSNSGKADVVLPGLQESNVWGKNIGDIICGSEEFKASLESTAADVYGPDDEEKLVKDFGLARDAAYEATKKLKDLEEELDDLQSMGVPGKKKEEEAAQSLDESPASSEDLSEADQKERTEAQVKEEIKAAILVKAAAKKEYAKLKALYKSWQTRQVLGITPGTPCQTDSSGNNRTGGPYTRRAPLEDIWHAPFYKLTSGEYKYDNTEVSTSPLKPYLQNGMDSYRVRAPSFPGQLLIPETPGNLGGGPQFRVWPGRANGHYNREIHVLMAKRLDLMNKAWLEGDPVRAVPPPPSRPKPKARKPMEAKSSRRRIFPDYRRNLVTPQGVQAQYDSMLRNEDGSVREPISKLALRAAESGDFAMRDGKILLEEHFQLMKTDIYGPDTGLVATYSPHETGLAIDFHLFSHKYPGNPIKDASVIKDLLTTAPTGDPEEITTTSATQRRQSITEWHYWMILHAYKFGITPLFSEAWHWECMLTRKAWFTNVEFCQPVVVSPPMRPYIDYARKIKERSTDTGQLTTDDKREAIQAGKHVGFI